MCLLFSNEALPQTVLLRSLTTCSTVSRPDDRLAVSGQVVSRAESRDEPVPGVHRQFRERPASRKLTGGLIRRFVVPLVTVEPEPGADGQAIGNPPCVLRVEAERA